MKNIHVLPTDKPSRLFVYDGKLGSAKGFQYGSGTIQNQNIYVTNQETIKKGDWLLKCKNINDWNFKSKELEEKDYSYFAVKCVSLALINPEDKKIILTDNKDLIKDGVQAIDDEFLESFVKNPSCDEVEVEEYYSFEIGDWVFKIILPKEELKQETLEEDLDEIKNIRLWLKDRKQRFIKQFKNK